MRKTVTSSGTGRSTKQKAPSGTSAPVPAVKPSVRRGDRLELLVTLFNDEGYGVAVHNGISVRIPGTLPGERVDVRIEKVFRGGALARSLKVLEYSPRRAARISCRESHECLGCPLMPMKYPDQADWKVNQVQREVGSYHSLQQVNVHKLLSPHKTTAYRTTARLAVAGTHADPYIGIYRRSTHDVYDLDNCPIHHPLINEVVNTVRKGIGRLRIQVYNPVTRRGLLRYLIVRVSEHEGGAMAVFVTSERSYNEIHHLARFLAESVPAVRVMAQNVNSSEGNVILGPKDHFLTDRKYLTEKIGETLLLLSPRSFFQVNRDGARMIYDQVRNWASLTGREKVLDLYCGIGGISLTLAPHAGMVLGVEVVEQAVLDARQNAVLNGMQNCRFEAGDVVDVIEDIRDEMGRVDLIILNPPRKGCDVSVIKSCVSLGPSMMIYVSCSPQSLARDLDILAKSGYSCREIQPVDMFPQTLHVECVARLEKRSA